MLSQSQVTCMLPVKDLARARRFYEERLALKPHGLRPDGKFIYRCGGTELALFPKAEGTKAEHTALSSKSMTSALLLPRLRRVASRSPITTFRDSRRSDMSACWARKRRPGSKTPRATFCACTRTLPEMIAPDDAYHGGMRRLQDRFDTRRLADRLVDKLSRTEFNDEDRAFIESRTLFFVATADREGVRIARTRVARRDSCA